MSCEKPANEPQTTDQPLDLSRKHNDKDIKQSLKSAIQMRRLAEGKELLEVTWLSKQDEPVTRQLTVEELEKQEERKEQNRRAAHKCRQKRKNKLQFYIMEMEREKKKKKVLQEKLTSLEKEKDMLLEKWRKDGTDLPNVKCEQADTASECHSRTCDCEKVSTNQNEGSEIKNNSSYSHKIIKDDFSYYSSIDKTNIDVKIKNFQYSDSGSDSDSSANYFVIYESETDSSDMFSNSQSS